MLASHRSAHAEADSNNGCLISTLKVITWKITCFLLPTAELLAIAGHITFKLVITVNIVQNETMVVILGLYKRGNSSLEHQVY